MQIVIAGGGPAGAICARTLARSGMRAIVIEASPHGKKPCAGGLPSVLLDQYPLPNLLIKQKTAGVMFQAPSGLKVPVDFPDGLFIATVDRQEFDNHLRWSAEDAGAKIVEGRVLGFEEKTNQLFIHYRGTDGAERTTEADFLIGADGASSRIARQAMGHSLDSVVAVQEEIQLPKEAMDRLENRCVFNYSPAVSPDYYGWIFPKGDHVSVGVGTRLENREIVAALLDRMKEIHSDILQGGRVIKRNGGLIPTEQYRQHGLRRVLLAGDAAGLVLPACGEGIYFAMRSGDIAAQTILQMGAKRPDILVSRYTDIVNQEFSPIFKYFEKIQRVTYSSPASREIFVRLARDRFMGRKILEAFASKTHRRTPPLKKLMVMFELMAIRFDVATRVSRLPGFGK
jgi:geranylgeranyl reductase